ncbi:MAG: HepT-like ribonuclease domain-containing protein [Gemmatimonadota bacterium]|nr:HepT-like ribonuclease domain-containing protein [Gemmatimonadota bacterium]
MKRNDDLYIGHMLDQARKAVDKASLKSREAYDADEDIRIILAHLVQMIGEAACRVSDITRTAHPDVPWKQIIGVRHRIVHDYMDVDYDVLWEIIRRDLPQLILKLASILGEE